MACTECKKKQEFREELERDNKLVSNGIVWFAIIWTILGGYGLYTLISKII